MDKRKTYGLAACIQTLVIWTQTMRKVYRATALSTLDGETKLIRRIGFPCRLCDQASFNLQPGA
jgi:hypothetical protein